MITEYGISNVNSLQPNNYLKVGVGIITAKISLVLYNLSMSFTQILYLNVSHTRKIVWVDESK